MKLFYIIVILSVLFWKGYYAWARGIATYVKDRREHDSLREYFLGNGATESQALRPFLQHAIVRAFRPLLNQWRLLLILIAFTILVGFFSDSLTIWYAILLLFAMIIAAALIILLAICLYSRVKK